MVFGELRDQKVGNTVTMFMKYRFTIIALCGLKNAIQMIHMQEGMFCSCQFAIIYLWQVISILILTFMSNSL